MDVKLNIHRFRKRKLSVPISSSDDAPTSSPGAVSHFNYNSHGVKDVRLDDLVLERCASLMDIISRILQEPVNRRFANLLRSANQFCEICFTVQSDITKSTTTTNELELMIGIACGSKSANWKIEVPLMNGYESTVELVSTSKLQQNTSAINSIKRPKNVLIQMVNETFIYHFNESLLKEGNYCAKAVDKISYLLLEIFSRFQHFHRVTFSRSSQWMRFVIDIMLNIFSWEQYRPASLKKLVFTTGTFYDGSSDFNLVISESQSHLIEIMVPLLEEIMLLDVKLPEEGSDLSKNFWNAIAKCADLKRLYLCRQREGPDLSLNSDVHDCLKSLNIREFHTFENNETSVDRWIFESFEHNKNIRKLFINSAGVDISEQLADPTAIGIVSRLRAVEIPAWTECLFGINEEAVKKNIYTIARALPESGYLNVEIIIIVRAQSFEQISKSTDDAETLKTLSFFIKLSDETRKSIRMYPRIHRCHNSPAIAITRQAVDELSKKEEFSGIEIEHRTSCSILRYNNAKITLYFELLAWKPYLTEAYIRNRAGFQHHVG